MAIRTLHIGVGGRGRWPLGLFRQREDLRPVALCDLRPAALAHARELSGLGEEVCFEHWREALEQVECDAVVIITPPPLHFEMCLAAVQRGRHVMVEKPFTTDLGEACEVVAAAEASGSKLVVCQQAKYAPVLAEAADLLASGQLGQPQFGLRSTFGFRPKVHHSAVQLDSYAWERGVHDFDTMLHLFGSPPERIQSLSFNPSWSPYRHGAGMHTILEFANGASCCFSCSFMSHAGGDLLRLDCEGGTLLVEAKQLRLRRAGADTDELIEPHDRPKAESIVTDLFVNWLGGSEEPVIGMHHNLQVMATVEAAGIASSAQMAIDVQEYLGQFQLT